MKKFHRALLFPKNPKVQTTPRRPTTPKKNNEKLCNFGNFVRDNALNSRFLLLYIGKRTLCLLKNVKFMQFRYV